MALTLAPTTPDPSHGEALFNAEVSAYLAWMSINASELNQMATAYNLSLSSTSSTSLTVATGAQSLTVQTGLGLLPGMPIRISSQATPTTVMDGVVTSYTSGSGALVVNVTSISGSGTLASWRVFILPSGSSFATLAANNYTGAQNFSQATDIASAATVNFTTATGNAINITGTTNITAVTLQNGAFRYGVFTGTPLLTYNAVNLNIQGGKDYQTKAGDRFICWAQSGTVYLTIVKQDGTSVVSAISSFGSFTATPSAGALGINIAAGVMDFRNSSLTSGVPQTVSYAAASLTIPAGATLGAPAAITSASATMAGTTTLTINTGPSAPIQVGAIIFQAGTRIGKVASLGTYVGGTGTGTIILDASATFTAQAIVIINPARLLVLLMANGELAVMNQSGGLPFDGMKLISTTAISAGSTANNIIYSTTARTNQPYRLIDILDVANATPGTYTTPELLYATSGSELAAMLAIGNGQSPVDVSAQRVIGQTYRNIEGRAITVYVGFNTSLASNNTFTLNGVAYLFTSSTSSQATGVSVVVPAGNSYSVTNSAGSIAGFNWIETK